MGVRDSSNNCDMLCVPNLELIANLLSQRPYPEKSIWLKLLYIRSAIDSLLLAPSRVNYSQAIRLEV